MMTTYYTNITDCVRGDDGQSIIVGNMYNENGKDVADSIIVAKGDALIIRTFTETPSPSLTISRADRTPKGELIVWVTSPLRNAEQRTRSLGLR